MISAGDYRYDYLTGTLSHAGTGKTAHLTRIVGAFLAAHMQNAGCTVPLAKIDQSVYGGATRSESVYRVLAYQARHALRAVGGDPVDLKAHRGVGYVLACESPPANRVMRLDHEQQSALLRLIDAAPPHLVGAAQSVREALYAAS